MPKVKITVTDGAGHRLSDEGIEATGPTEACANAVADAGTAAVAETEEHVEPMRLTTGNDGCPIGDESRSRSGGVT